MSLSFLSISSCIIIALLHLCLAEDPTAPMTGIIDFNDENIDGLLVGKPFLIEFYAPWCGWCKRLAPIWKELGEKVGESNPKIGIGKVDVTEAAATGKKYSVNGFPTILLVKEDGSTVKYSSERTVEGFLSFIEKHTGAIGSDSQDSPKEDSNTQEKAPVATEQHIKKDGEVVILNPDNFDTIVKDGNKHVFVKFFAPWCGHCKQMATTWKSLADDLKDNKNIVIAELDGSEHGAQSSAYGVRGFPTIKLFAKNDKSGKLDFQGSRDLNSFKKFLGDNKCL